MVKAVTKKHKNKLVYLEWLDSCSCIGVWNSKDIVEDMSPDTASTVGYIVNETKDFITVVSSISEYQYSGSMCIPKFAITKRKNINGPKA